MTDQPPTIVALNDDPGATLSSVQAHLHEYLALPNRPNG